MTDAERWFRNPYTLDVPVVDPSFRFVPCIVCMSDTKMSIGFDVHDGDPQQSVEVFAGPTRAPVAVFRVFRNDTLLLKKDNWLGSTVQDPERSGQVPRDRAADAPVDGVVAVHEPADRRDLQLAVGTARAVQLVLLPGEALFDPSDPDRVDRPAHHDARHDPRRSRLVRPPGRPCHRHLRGRHHERDGRGAPDRHARLAAAHDDRARRRRRIARRSPSRTGWRTGTSICA